MKREPGDALKELELAVIDLATGEENIKVRLLGVFRNRLHIVNEEDFPDSLKDDWIWIKRKVTKDGPEIDSDGNIYFGSIENTIKAMRKKTGSEIAGKIVVFSEKLRAYFEDKANVS